MNEKLKGVISLVVICFFVYSCAKGGGNNSSNQAKEPEDPRFKCASAWDGSVIGIKYEMEKQLRDPSSFEHIETKFTPVDPDKNTVRFTMKFRAKNGFGGMNIGMAIGEIYNPSCRITSVSIVE